MYTPLLSTGEAAKLAGLSEDHIRRLANRNIIDCTRTPGGHRRFREDVVLDYVENRPRRQPRVRHPKPQPRNERQDIDAAVEFLSQLDYPDEEEWVEPEPARPAPQPRASVVPQVQEPAIPFGSPSPFDDVDERTAEEETRKAEEQAQKVREESARIRNLKLGAMACIPYDVPSVWRSKVITSLEQKVTSERVSSWLPHHEQANQATSVVEETLQPYREEKKREKEQQRIELEHKRAEAEREKRKEKERKKSERRREEEREKSEQRKQQLVDHGMKYAGDETWGWDYSSKTDAKREVEAVLKRDVEQDWTEHEVENLVDDVLADWDPNDNDGDEW